MRLFVVLRAAETRGDRPPIVLLHGGPGESALVPMVRTWHQQGPLNFDVVAYDQRGAGLSQPDPCPEYAGRSTELLAERPDGRGVLETVARECVASMRSRNIDPAAFNTAANVADLIDLRLAFGYARWDLYGNSYGARLALEAMRRDHDGIRSVVLDNAIQPGRESAEAPLATQHALERVFAACNRSVPCDSAFSDLQTTFLAVFDSLQQSPLALPAADGSTRSVMLAAEDFAGAVRRLLRSRAAIAALPLVLSELNAGDRERAARELLDARPGGSGNAGRATFWLVQCHDQYSPAYGARADSVRALVWRPLKSLRNDLQQCPAWQSGTAAAEFSEPVVSDIPTLILNGEFDPRAPVEFGRRIASTLSHAWFFPMPGETHSGAPSRCRAEIIAQFAADPHHKPEATCIARMPPTEFRTRWP